MQHLSPAIRVDEDEAVVFYYNNTSNEVLSFLTDILEQAGFQKAEGDEKSGLFSSDTKVRYTITESSIGTELGIAQLDKNLQIIKRQETGLDDITRLFVAEPIKGSKPELVRDTDYNGSPRRYELYKANDFNSLTHITQVYGVAVNSDNQVLVVGTKPERWSLPGGGTERGESLADTLNREMYEEAAITIQQDSITPLFYQYSYVEDTKNPGDLMFFATQVRFICRLEKSEVFENDPGGETQFQKWVDLDELEVYLPWGNQVDFIKDLVEKYFAVGG